MVPAVITSNGYGKERVQSQHRASMGNISGLSSIPPHVRARAWTFHNINSHTRLTRRRIKQAETRFSREREELIIRDLGWNISLGEFLLFGYGIRIFFFLSKIGMEKCEESFHLIVLRSLISMIFARWERGFLDFDSINVFYKIFLFGSNFCILNYNLSNKLQILLFRFVILAMKEYRRIPQVFIYLEK